jgi:hypothetical protein
MTGRIEILHYGKLIYRERFRLWEIEELPWEKKVQSRERQFNLKLSRLLKSMPFYDPDHIKIFVTFKSKMNDGKIPDIQEVQKREGVHEAQ